MGWYKQKYKIFKNAIQILWLYGLAYSFFLHKKAFPILLDYCTVVILLKRWTPAGWSQGDPSPAKDRHTNPQTN